MESGDNYFIKNNKLYMIIIAVFIVIVILYGHILLGVISIILYGILARCPSENGASATQASF